jgi:hypothetical protein
MEILKAIVWESVEIITIIFGLLGMAVSFLLLFSHEMTRKICDTFNQNISAGNLVFLLNQTIRTDRFIYNHHVLSGIAIAAGSVSLLFFLLFRLEMPDFVLIYGASGGLSVLSEILFRSLTLFGLVVSAFGLLIGVVLMISVDAMARLDRPLNRWIPTQHWLDRLDAGHYGVDSIFFRYPTFFGGLGLAASVLLILLSVLNLFST